MANKKEADNSKGLLKHFDDLKKKHPDAMLLFRQGDFYEMYKEDAVKASVILGIAVAEKMLPGERTDMTIAKFAHHALDTYLPKLIRSGARVAICDPIVVTKQQKAEKEATVKELITPNNEHMSKKEKQKKSQEEPAKTSKVKTEEKPVKEQKKKNKTKVRTETKTNSKVESKPEQQADKKQERKPREPQMVTANGEKVTHGHAYQSKTNPEEWYFTARMDGKQLKPQRMEAADLAAFQKKELTVPQLMERYYPTKLMPKVAEETYKLPKDIAGPEGNITVNKFNVYKEKDEQRPDFGKYKFYVQIGDAKMSAVASRQDLNAYFDRVMTPGQLVEKNFGERLHLKSAYEKYQLPEGVDSKDVRVAKDRTDNKWKVSVNLGDKGQTTKHEISFDDGYSLFKAKTATREQIAAKYLNPEITSMLAAPAAKVDRTASMKR